MKQDSIPPSPPKSKKTFRLRLALLVSALLVLLAAYRPMRRMQADSLLRRSLLNGEIAGVREALDRDADPDLALDPSQIEAHIGSLADIARLFTYRSAPPDPNAKTALMFAANSSHPDMVEALLKHGAHVNRQQAGGYSALLYSASKASPSIVESLLEKGANVNVQNREGVTPLLSAVQAGQLPNVRLLLAKGADVHAEDKKGQTALSLAIENPLGSLHTRSVSEEAVALLLAKGADERDLLPRHLAAVTTVTIYAPGDPIPAQPAIAMTGGAYVPTPLPRKVQAAPKAAPPPPPPITPIVYAAKYGNLALLQVLWSHADAGARQRSGPEALCKAVRSRAKGCVQFLLDQHVPVSASPSLASGPAIADRDGGYTPLHFAVISPSGMPLAQLLLAQGADVNAAATNGVTPLLVAVDSADPRMVQLLLAHGANVHAVDAATGRNALIRGVNRTELVHLFLAHGLDVNARDNRGRTALMGCSIPLNASLLLAHGADVNLQDHEGNTALMLSAREHSSANMITLLLQHGAKVDARNNLGATALMQCIDPRNAALLIAQGAQINLQDAQGDTALTYAIREIPQRNGTDSISLLLKNGANINVPNRGGETPLSIARHAPQASMVVPLLTSVPAKH